MASVSLSVHLPPLFPLSHSPHPSHTGLCNSWNMKNMLFSTFELAVLSASLYCSLFQTCSNASSLERTSPNTLSKIAISPYNSLFLIIALADTTLYIYLYSCSLYPTITKTTSIFYSQLYPLCLKQCLAHNRC